MLLFRFSEYRNVDFEESVRGRWGRTHKRRGRNATEMTNPQPIENVRQYSKAGHGGQIGQKYPTYTRKTQLPPDPNGHARAGTRYFSAPSAPCAPIDMQHTVIQQLSLRPQQQKSAPARGRTSRTAPIFEEEGCRGAGCGRRHARDMPP